MITNERQYKIAKSGLAKLNDSIEQLDFASAKETSGGDEVLIKAQVDEFKRECEDLSKQLGEYESLKAGSVQNLEARNLSDLPGLLIRARIATGLSQKGLAEKLGLKEQQIQRYEAEEYSSASLRRLIEVSDA